MKYLLICFLFLTLQLSGQREINEIISLSGANEVQFNFSFADVELLEWNKPDVQIIGQANINLNLDNEAFKIKTERPNGILIIHSTVDLEDIPKRVIFTNEDGTKRIADPSSLDDEKIYQNVNWGSDIDVSLKIMIPKGVKVLSNSTYGNQKLFQISQLEMAHASYGSIEAHLPSKGISNDVDLVANYAFVDVSIPNDVPLKFSVTSNYGEIFSDLDLQTSNGLNKSKQCHTNSTLNADLRNGKYTVNITANYDNVYLRNTDFADTGRQKKGINRF